MASASWSRFCTRTPTGISQASGNTGVLLCFHSARIQQQSANKSLGSFLPFDCTEHGKCLGSSWKENERERKVSMCLHRSSSVFFHLKEFFFFFQMSTFLSFTSYFLRQNVTMFLRSFIVAVLCDRILCSPGWPQTQYTVIAGLKILIFLHCAQLTYMGGGLCAGVYGWSVGWLVGWFLARFLCVALTILELDLLARFTLNSEICLLLPP